MKSHMDPVLIIRFARNAFEHAVKENEYYQASLPESWWDEKYGVFVTLKKENELRGCIGYVLAKYSLKEGICQNAYHAALKDPRFPPVKEAELNDISLEVSLLSPLQEVINLSDIQIGKHGLMIEHLGRTGLLLPQVATEHHLSRDEFIAAVCQKAGLLQNVLENGATLYQFEAWIIQE